MPTLTGTMSYFGGPDDTGVSSSEGLALCEPSEMDIFPDNMFLSQQPPGTSGLARRLNPDAMYIAMRWDYDITPKSYLQTAVVIVTNPANRRVAAATPIDWGPNEATGRIADLSPGLCEYLDLSTDDTCTCDYLYPSEELPLPPEEVELPPPTVGTPRYARVVISSGHGLYVRGASGVLDEVDEARKVVETLAADLRTMNVNVKTFHDNSSKDQNTNLNTIVNYHNAQNRDLDVSVHFNAYQTTSKPMGTECLYVSQSTLAGEVSKAIASVGFINRGPKKRTDLFFLNNTEEPAILIETCFVDSSSDADIYHRNYDAICTAVAKVLRG